MKKEFNLVVSPQTAYNEQLLKEDIAEQLGLSKNDTLFIQPLRRSIDS